MVAVISLNSQTFLGHNQAIYQDLRLALQINLRRQLLIAVCDDSQLQAQLAQRLETDLSPYSERPYSDQPYSDQGERNSTGRADQSPLVTLRLDGHHPDLVREVLLWLKHQRWLGGSAPTIPAFQILGVETLTCQSPTIQNRFLASLIRVDALLTQLDCRLLVWVPRPWLGKIQQVVPGFWRSRSGLFEFAGEPTAAAPPWGGDSLASQALSPPQSSVTKATEAEVNSAHPLPVEVETRRQETPVTLAAPEPSPATETTALPPAPALATPPLEPQIPPLPIALAQDEQMVQLWQYIQLLQAQQAGPLTLARAHLSLGQLSRDRVEAGAMALPVLDFAMAVYQRAIAGLLAGETDWCDALNDLASLYWLRSQQATQPEEMSHWLHRSVAAYQQAIGDPTSVPPTTLSRVYGNLGSVYGLLANFSDPLSNLEQSVRAYHQALHYLSAETATLDYANLQNSLGAVHWRLSQIERPSYHLHQAITAYTEALRHRSPQTNPQEYAMVQNNLGIAYWSLAQHERPIVLLGQAIAAYQAALAYRTLATPAGCAATHNNLGTAYWDLAQQQAQHPDRRQHSLIQAVAAYEAALDAAERALQQASPDSLGFDVWATFHSAGVVHDQLAQVLPVDQQAERDRHLQAALGHYLLAYQGWQHSPEQLDILIEALVYTVRLNFEILGMAGQQAVLSKLPAELLAQVLPKL